MDSSRTSRRRLIPFALGAAGVVALVAVLGLMGADGGWIASLVRAAPDEPTQEELTAAALAAAATARGPQLLASEKAKTRETHGPVTVSVVDRAGAPVEGVCVLAVVYAPPDPNGTTRQERLEQEFTDATGRARFHDLPFDGCAFATARARAPGDPTELGGVVGRARRLAGAIQLTLASSSQDPHAAGAGEGLAVWGVESLQQLATDPMTQLSYSYHDPKAVDELGTVLAGSVGLLLAGAPVTGPEVTLTIDRGLPFELRVHEAGEGHLRPDARWHVRPRLAWADDAYGAASLPLARGKAAQVTCLVAAPKGFVPPREEAWSVFVHPLAQRLVAVYPLRPAVDVLVLLPPEVMPYRPEDWEGSITVAGARIDEPDLHVDAQGRLRVRGGEYLVGDTVEVNGTLGKRFHVKGQGYIGPDPRQPVLVPVEVTPPPSANELAAAKAERLGSGPTLYFGKGRRTRLEHGGTRALPATPIDLPPEDLEAAVALEEFLRVYAASLAELPVRAVAWNGSPAAGALLRQGEQELVADAQGRATFRDVPPGAASIVVLGAGATTIVRVEVGPAPRSEAVVTARAGGTLAVEVVDSEGRPLPYAGVSLWQADGQEYADCVDGVQRLDPHTDEMGRRTFRAVCAGTVKVRAVFGTRSAERHLQLADGGHEVVRLELPTNTPATK